MAGQFTPGGGAARIRVTFPWALREYVVRPATPGSATPAGAHTVFAPDSVRVKVVTVPSSSVKVIVQVRFGADPATDTASFAPSRDVSWSAAV